MDLRSKNRNLKREYFKERGDPIEEEKGEWKMTLLLLVGLVVFFLAGYKLHHHQYQELLAEATHYAKLAKEGHREAKELQDVARNHSDELRDQMVALTANDQERAARHKILIEENSLLKNQIFLLQRKCTCGGLNNVGK